MIETDALMDAVAVEIHWPQVFSESVKRKEGLVLFSGTRESHLHLLETAVPVESLRNSDVVIHKGASHRAGVEEVINLAEEGRMVIQAMMAPSVISSLHKVFSALEGNPHLIWRFVDQLVLVVNQIKIKDLKSRDFFIHEVMLATPAIKKILLSGRVEELENLLKENKEDQGVVSLNQTLLQLLIRRKIDLKTAFARTRDPENLDLLLKRVGI